MPTLPQPPARRGPAVHSLHRFAFSVPDLARAGEFYAAFGLEPRQVDGRLDLHTHGNAHCWARLHLGNGAKQLEYLCFSVFPDDYDALAARVARGGVRRAAPHRHGEEGGFWITDPDGTPVHVVAAGKVSPSFREPDRAASVPPPGTGAAPSRSGVAAVRPRRLSHVLLFSSDVLRSVRFYADVLGLRLSDHSGDLIAFMHGTHASDHHMLAFAKSNGPGLHHSSWDVASIDEVGLGMQQMIDRGYPDGWGVGRHVIGSNYFRYVRDPWGSYAEYSYGIDFIPADLEWEPTDHAPEDSFYVWAPPVPDDFIVNHETAARLCSA